MTQFLGNLPRKFRRRMAQCLTAALAAGTVMMPAYGASGLASESLGLKGANYIDLSGKNEYKGVKLATGATVTKGALAKDDNRVNIEDFGAVALENRAEDDEDTHAIENTKAINEAIQSLAMDGGEILVPAGTFRVYTIELESNVNIYLEEGAVLQAAKTEMYDRQGNVTSEAEDYDEDGTPGNYLQPEVNIYAGLQDGGHTYFANSMLYAADKENIMIYGEGRLDGSQMNDEGSLDQVLSGGDPGNPRYRTGQIETWYGNKAIALLRCENVVLSDFDILNGGHFAVIMEGTKNMLVDNMVIDTNRDAFNIDCGQDVTIQNSHFNSLTDDAIVFKASYGAGIMMPVENCLVKNCIVSGYDAGSVLAGTYTTDKQVATDLCGPTARIKFGTESTCGYNTVTIDGVKFQRSRGFCLESVDGSAIHDIIMVNAEMDTISSSPIYIRIGNRGRYPVTGNSTEPLVNASNNVRLTNSGWVLPLNSEDSEYEWTEYPIRQYFPAYNYLSGNDKVEMPNGTTIDIVNQEEPARINENNFFEAEDGTLYEYKWDSQTHEYVVNYDKKINIATDSDAEKASASNAQVDERYYYGDAVGYSGLATAYNIYVGNVKITNVDPRYPITLTGLVDSKIENVTFEDIDVTYRGGLRMQDAVEQQLVKTTWEYTQYMTAPATQTLHWLSNTFFSKRASLLPRVIWDDTREEWVDEPYNVPEMQEQYPEPSNFGILPAYGMYARHVDGLKLKNVTFGFEIEDERHAVVLDDCQNVNFDSFKADVKDDVKLVAQISNNYKRKSGFEYVPNQPYLKTECKNITGLNTEDVYTHTVNAPEPSTPKDSLYSKETVASVDTGYEYGENVWTYNGEEFDLPVTVHRPFFSNMDQKVTEGQDVSFIVEARNPAAERDGERDQAASDATLEYSVKNLPAGAKFDPATKEFTWPAPKAGIYHVTFTADDGVLPVSTTVTIEVGEFSKLVQDAEDYLTKELEAAPVRSTTAGTSEEAAKEALMSAIQDILAKFNADNNMSFNLVDLEDIEYKAPVNGTRTTPQGEDGYIKANAVIGYSAQTSDGGSGQVNVSLKAATINPGTDSGTVSIPVELVLKATAYSSRGSGSGSGSSGSSSSNRSAASGSWKSDANGWWYERADGTYPAAAWESLEWNGQSCWYYFNESGYCVGGWFTDANGSTYYLHNQHDGNFGRMYTGWNEIDGKSYYFEPVAGQDQGHLYRGTTTPDGYQVDDNGAWIN